MLKMVFNHPVLMTWLSYFVKYGAAIFVLPLVLIKFSTEEVAVWLLFSIVQGIAMLADSGFGPTIARATSYFRSGADKLPTNLEELRQNKLKSAVPNCKQLTVLVATTGRIYFLLSLMAVLLLLTAGIFIVYNVIHLAGNRADLWAAYAALVFFCVTCIQSIRWVSIIQGLDKVATIRRFESLVSVFTVSGWGILLILNYNIFEMLLVSLCAQIVILIYAKNFVNKWLNSQSDRVDTAVVKFDKQMFKTIWPATWKFGGVIWGGYLISNGVAILVSQLDDAVLIASYLVTIRVILMFSQFAQAPLYANLPRVTQMMAKHDFERLRVYVSKGVFSGLFILIFSLVMMGLFGNKLLGYLNVDVMFISMEIFIVLSIWVILEMHHVAHAQIYMSSNHVPFLLPAVISGIAIIGIGFFTLEKFGLFGLVLTQLCVQASFNNWYPVMLSLRLLKWPFRQYVVEMPLIGSQYLLKLATGRQRL